MKLSKENNKIIVELPYWQEGDFTYGEGKWKVNNLVGIITDKEITISYVNYLDYKGVVQEGIPVIYYAFQPSEKDKEVFRKLCKKLGLEVWEYPSCEKCKEVLRGSHTVGEKGMMCWDCAEKIK